MTKQRSSLRKKANNNNAHEEKRVSFADPVESQSSSKKLLKRTDSGKPTTGTTAKKQKTSDEFTESLMTSFEQDEIAQELNDFKKKLLKQHESVNELVTNDVSSTETVSSISTKIQMLQLSGTEEAVNLKNLEDRMQQAISHAEKSYKEIQDSLQAQSTFNSTIGSLNKFLDSIEIPDFDENLDDSGFLDVTKDFNVDFDQLLKFLESSV